MHLRHPHTLAHAHTHTCILAQTVNHPRQLLPPLPAALSRRMPGSWWASASCVFEAMSTDACRSQWCWHRPAGPSRASQERRPPWSHPLAHLHPSPELGPSTPGPGLHMGLHLPTGFVLQPSVQAHVAQNPTPRHGAWHCDQPSHSPATPEWGETPKVPGEWNPGGGLGLSANRPFNGL